MVRGIEKFKEYFAGYEGNYIIIGGTAIPIDEDLSSLSAILMNDDYYFFTLEHSATEEGVRLANIESLICLKAKAFLDLSERKAKGEAIDEKNIRKHKNDIFRLATLLNETDIFSLPMEIKTDLNNFCLQVAQSLPDKAFFKSIGLSATTQPDNVFGLLCKAFQLEQEKNEGTICFRFAFGILR
jgi:hypothetical protein